MSDLSTKVRATSGVPTASSAARLWKRFSKKKLGVISLVFVILLVIIAILAPWISPHSPTVQDLSARNLSPNATYWLGTDDLGRDQLSRLMHGARITLTAPLIAVSIGLAFGVPTGLIAGFFGGPLDWFLDRTSDAVFSIPGLVLAMTFVGIRGPSTTNAMIAVGIGLAPRIFRIVRSSTLRLKHELFVDAARSMGASGWRIIGTHIAPNIVGILTVQTTVLMGLGVLTEAGLSFLGIGVQPPEASWGVILRRMFDNIYAQPFGSVIPGVLITLLILSFQFIGDALHESLGKETSGGGK